MPIARHNGTLVVATGDPFDVYALDELQTLTGLHVSRCWPARARSPGSSSTTSASAATPSPPWSQEREPRTTSNCSKDIEADDSETGQAGPGSLGRQAGQRDPDRGRQRAGQRHPHRAAKKTACASATASTACCRRRTCRRRSTASRPRSSAASRSWRGSTSPRSACRRTAASRCSVQGREIDVRVSIIPMIHGEGIVMRLLDKGRMVFNLAERRHAAGHLQAPSSSSSTGRTASCWSPARPAPANRPRSTRPSTRSRTRRSRSSRSKTRSNTSRRASARSRCTPRSA